MCCPLRTHDTFNCSCFIAMFFFKTTSVRHCVCSSCKNTADQLTVCSASIDGNVSVLTQQNNDTGQYGDQSPGAESGWENVGLHVAGQDGVFAVAGADADGQGVGAAQGGKAVVVYFDGKVVHVLCQPAESFPEHNHAGRAVCKGRSKQGAWWMKRWIYGIRKHLQNTMLLAWLFIPDRSLFPALAHGATDRHCARTGTNEVWLGDIKFLLTRRCFHQLRKKCNQKLLLLLLWHALPRLLSASVSRGENNAFKLLHRLWHRLDEASSSSSKSHINMKIH